WPFNKKDRMKVGIDDASRDATKYVRHVRRTPDQFNGPTGQCESDSNSSSASVPTATATSCETDSTGQPLSRENEVSFTSDASARGPLLRSESLPGTFNSSM